MRGFYPLMISLLLFAGGCDDGAPVPPASNQILFINGAIYTVNPAQPWAEALLIEEGVIRFVGTEAETMAQADADAQTIDLQGKMAMPGLHDVHLHPLEAASDNFHFTVSPTATQVSQYTSAIEAALQQNPNAEWVLGWGFSLYTLLDDPRSPKAILDALAPNRPLAIMEETSHSIWCNSAALAAAGLTAASPDPVGGLMVRDETGAPNGLLLDNAGNLLIDLALAPTSNRENNDYDGLVNYALPLLAQHGITSICDARTYWKRNHHQTWQRVADAGQLTVRVNLGLWAYPTEDDATQIATLQSLYSHAPNRLLNINQIKVYMDGIVHNTTAALHENYLIDLFERPANKGLNYFTEERLATYIQTLEATGFDFHIHAIGDRGVTEALNAIEQGTSGQGRHRITHVEMVTPSDYARFKALNVTADAQVAGDFTQPQYWSDNDELVGAARADDWIPLAALHAAGARITLSSDWDVSSINPFVGIQNAVTRTPQHLSLADALAAYTRHAAYVMRQEDRVGSLEVSKLADFIVLDRNLFEIPMTQIAQTRVETTYLQGQVVYPR